MGETVVRKGPRRADAQHNYEVILAAARAAVAERGGDIVLEEIARNAGVGIGTLYRHFPTRQAILEAAFLDEASNFVNGRSIAIGSNAARCVDRLAATTNGLWGTRTKYGCRSHECEAHGRH